MIVHAPTLIRLPGMVQAQVYCAAETMSPAFAEHIATIVERLTGLAFSHSVRNVFPAVRKMSIADEAAAAWKAPGRRFRISNAAGSAEHIQLSAGVFPRRSEAGRVDYGYVMLAFGAGAAAAVKVADGLALLVKECEGIYARADAPMWGVETGNPDAFGTLEMPVAPGWILSERLGWATYLPPGVSDAMTPRAARALADLGVQIEKLQRGQVLRLSAVPITESNPADLDRYRAVREILRGSLAAHA